MKLKGILLIFMMIFIASCEKSDIIIQQPAENKVEKPEQEEVIVPEIEQYIVVYRKDAIFTKGASIGALASEVSALVGSKVKRVFSKTIYASVNELSGEQVLQLRQHPMVKSIEKDLYVQVGAAQLRPEFHLDRIDQESVQLDGSYTYVEGGAEVNAYVIDTGVNATHEEFEGRARHGFDFVDNDSDSSDCNGHGTHVAGLVGGKLYGAAKNVIIHGVRVLSCSGSGRFSDVIAGIEWVTENHVKPAVVNMSLGGGASVSIDQAIQASIESGISYVVAAGNENQDACNSSPARTPEAITVGSSTISDSRSRFSNHGSCVDLFAPGSDIKSAWVGGDSATRTISGTSMASPLVAGVVAQYLSVNPEASPAQVAEALLEGATVGALSGLPSNTVNKLVNNQYISAEEGGEEEEEEEEEEREPGQLFSGESIENLSGSRRDIVRFHVNLKEDVESLTVRLSGGRGDADLYLLKDNEPSTIRFQCRPFFLGNNETCTVVKPDPGVYHIMVRAYSSYSGAMLRVEF